MQISYMQISILGRIITLYYESFSYSFYLMHYSCISKWELVKM